MTEQTNEDCLHSLGGSAAADEAAVAELREVHRRGLRRALTGRAAADDGFIEDMAQEEGLEGPRRPDDIPRRRAVETLPPDQREAALLQLVSEGGPRVTQALLAYLSQTEAVKASATTRSA